ncbi:hypothetical protein L249_1161 [Ophiocordyceps polyrhachis-furcata BCC 54312]|uniref:Uncharacterized protein n=1 Tax=Ophiocordyceps polyrhachis-furcata BCC 54312 TaxID=1330021 RepID=A0A367LDH1_9HYPO|nr:hypothetical protein L249_1161 [Ophiocordyceps polyrhachis-furcata BCC 54312]
MLLKHLVLTAICSLQSVSATPLADGQVLARTDYNNCGKDATSQIFSFVGETTWGLQQGGNAL